MLISAATWLRKMEKGRKKAMPFELTSMEVSCKELSFRERKEDRSTGKDILGFWPASERDRKRKGASFRVRWADPTEAHRSL